MCVCVSTTIPGCYYYDSFKKSKNIAYLLRMRSGVVAMETTRAPNSLARQTEYKTSKTKRRRKATEIVGSLHFLPPSLRSKSSSLSPRSYILATCCALFRTSDYSGIDGSATEDSMAVRRLRRTSAACLPTTASTAPSRTARRGRRKPRSLT